MIHIRPTDALQMRRECTPPMTLEAEAEFRRTLRESGVRFAFDRIPPTLNGDGEKLPGATRKKTSAGKGLLRMTYHERHDLQQFWNAAVFVAAYEPGGLGLHPLLTIAKCKIETTLYVSKLMDWDNAYSAFKLLGDALVAAGVILDDSPVVVESLNCKQVKVSPNQRGYYVHIIPSEFARIGPSPRR